MHILITKIVNYKVLLLLSIIVTITVSIPQVFAHEYELEKPVMCSFVEYNGNCYPELSFSIYTENRAPPVYDWDVYLTAVVGEEVYVACYSLETIDAITMELRIYDENDNLILESKVADPDFNRSWPYYTFQDTAQYTIECHAHNDDIYVEKGFDPVVFLRDIVIPEPAEPVEVRKSISEISELETSEIKRAISESNISERLELACEEYGNNSSRTHSCE